MTCQSEKNAGTVLMEQTDQESTQHHRREDLIQVKVAFQSLQDFPQVPNKQNARFSKYLN